MKIQQKSHKIDDFTEIALGTGCALFVVALLAMLFAVAYLIVGAGHWLFTL